MQYFKKYISLILLIVATHSKAAIPDSLLWIQQPAISPDGQWIAFEYKGGLYKVSSSGGAAIPLTINKAYNGYPKWSHDGSQIAFASDRYGNFDVFIMSSAGGEATRLTYSSSKDIPCDFSKDDREVYYETNRHDVYTSVRFPDDDTWLKLFAVPAKGGRSVMINSAGTEFVNFNQAGNKFLFQDRKGYENAWRKHQISPIARDIWMYDMVNKSYTKLTDFKGEDREPVWGNGNAFYYLSERNGNQNIFGSSLENPSFVRQLTTFTQNPVRNLSRSDNGMLAFTQDGELFTLEEGKAPQKILITLPADFNHQEIENIAIKGAGKEMFVSPNGKEIAFVYRGDVFVVSASGSETKQITHTAKQERMVNFSPDGRNILYAVENEGSWDIYKATIANSNEPYFYAATTINTEPVIATPKDEFQGTYSPDGKNIAYLEDGEILKVFNIASKKAITLMPKGLNISGFDGDQSFSWSPDGRYIVIRSCNGFEGRSDIDVVKADGTEKPVNLTKSAFFNLNPKWGMGGKMIYYASTKTGLSNLTGFGQQDVFTLFLDRAAFEKYGMSNEDIELSTEHHRLDSLQHIRSTPKNFKGAIANSFQPDFNNLDDRSQRLTIASALISDDVLSPDGEKLYTLSSFGNNTDLWVTYPRTHDSKLLAKLNVDDGNLAISPDGKTLYLLSGDQLSKISTDDGSVSAISINGTMGLDKAKERAYIFEHAYHIINRRFWDPNLHGVDFKYYYHEYARFLPHINNNYDFQLLLNEFLGELNSSHSGAGYRPSFPEGDQTAALGLLYDLNSSGNGLKVTSILKGGPFDNTETQINTGDVIEKIDGKPINADEDWAELLKFKAGKNTLISIYNPKNNRRWEETVKPISMATETENLLYKRWLHQMEHLTDSLSHGTIGYLHIREMDEGNFRATLETAVGKLTGKKAIIIDTRYNTGGGIHEELMALFTVDNTLVDRPQSRNLLNEGSTSGISKPTCVLISEGNYSDGFNFPYLYQERKAGKLIGMPAAGTGTGVWWERQIDSSLYFGIPQIGLSLPGTNQPLLEGHQLNPDILISNDYNKILNGRDQQLEAAVNELLKQ